MENNPLETKQEYSKYVDKKSPNSPILLMHFGLED